MIIDRNTAKWIRPTDTFREDYLRLSNGNDTSKQILRLHLWNSARPLLREQSPTRSEEECTQSVSLFVLQKYLNFAEEIRRTNMQYMREWDAFNESIIYIVLYFQQPILERARRFFVKNSNVLREVVLPMHHWTFSGTISIVTHRENRISITVITRVRREESSLVAPFINCWASIELDVVYRRCTAIADDYNQTVPDEREQHSVTEEMKTSSPRITTWLAEVNARRCRVHLSFLNLIDEYSFLFRFQAMTYGKREHRWFLWKHCSE